MATIRAAANSMAKGIPSRPVADLYHRGGVVGVAQPEPGHHRLRAFHEQLHRRRTHPGVHLEGGNRPQMLGGDLGSRRV
jgi:hypothetical protein